MIRVMIRVGIRANVNVWVIARDAVMVTVKATVRVRVRVRDNPKCNCSLSLTSTHEHLLKMNTIKLLYSNSMVSKL